jgi:predicted nucleic acid-binding protein
MEAMKVATLIEALRLVAQVYRSKDGSEPAEAVKKILQQLETGSNMTLAEWVRAKQSVNVSSAKRRATKKPEPANLGKVRERLERAPTQAALHEAVTGLSLTAADWKALARQLTGRAGSSGAAARIAVQTHLSDRLLLDERVESIKRQFNPLTPPPAAS